MKTWTSSVGPCSGCGVRMSADSMHLVVTFDAVQRALHYCASCALRVFGASPPVLEAPSPSRALPLDSFTAIGQTARDWKAKQAVEGE